MKKLLCLVVVTGLLAGCESKNGPLNPSSSPQSATQQSASGKTYNIQELLNGIDLSEAEKEQVRRRVEANQTTLSEVELTKIKNYAASASRRHSPRIRLDDVLKRTDLSEAARSELNRMKLEGAITMSEYDIEAIIDKHNPATVRSRFSDYRNPAKVPPPTQSRFDRSASGAVTYPTSPLQGYDYCLGRSEYWAIGVEYFKSNDLPNVAVDAKAQANVFIQEVVNSISFSMFDERWSKLLNEAKQLYDAEQGLRHDPMFLLCVGIVYARNSDPKEASRLIEKSMFVFERTEYPTRIVVQANRLFHANRVERPSQEDAAKQAARYFVAVNHWLSNDFRAQPAHLRYAYEDVQSFVKFCLRNNDIELLDAFNQSFSNQTHLPEWLRAIVRGGYYHGLAWHYRGGGFVNTVNAVGWEKFKEYEEKSAGFFKQAHAICPQFPETASSMIEICRAGHSPETEDHWLEECLDVDPTYFPAYASRLYGLTPQWGGSPREMIEFAFENSRNAPEGSSVPFLVLHCLSLLEKNAGLSREMIDELMATQPFQDGMTDAVNQLIANEYGPIVENRIKSEGYMLTAQAVLATRFGDMEVAHQSFQILGNEYDQSAAQICGMANMTFDRFRAPAYALTSEFQNEALELKELFGDTYDDRMDNSRKILQLTANVLRENTDPIGSLYFKQIEQKVRWERKYKSGQEIHLEFDPALMNWKTANLSQIQVDSPSSVRIDNRTGAAQFFLAADIKMNGPKKIQFDIEFSDDDQEGTTDPADLAPAILIGTVLNANISVALMSKHKLAYLQMEPYHAAKLQFGFYGLKKEDFSPYYTTAIKEGTNTININVGIEYFEVYLNDNFQFRTRRGGMTKLFDHVEFCQNMANQGRAKFKISNIRVKQWESGAPPFTDNIEVLIAYYENEIELEPESKWNTFWLAHLHQANGDNQKAIELYLKAIELELPMAVAAFYLGDAYEKTGDPEKAKECYAIAADKKNMTFKRYLRYVGETTYSIPENWAAFRLQWINSFSEDGDRSHNQNHFAFSDVPHHLRWIKRVYWAKYYADKGEFDRSIEELGWALPDCPAEHEAEVLAMLKCYESEKTYTPTKDEPLYIRVENPFPFFRYFEDNMPAGFRDLWQKGKFDNMR